jgi:transposase-like protein
MSWKRFTPKKIIAKLRKAEIALAQCNTVGQICRQLSIAEQTYHRWRTAFSRDFEIDMSCLPYWHNRWIKDFIQGWIKT